MRILLLTARRLPNDRDAVPAEDVAAQFAAALRSPTGGGVAHLMVFHVSAELVQFAVFLRAGTSTVPDVGGAEGWAVDHTSPNHDLW